MAKKVKVGGRVIGEVENGTLFKRVQGSKHFLTKPPAICVDEQVFRDLVAKSGVEDVCVTDTETGIVYTVKAQVMLDKSLRFDRGRGWQLGLPLKHWQVGP